MPNPVPDRPAGGAADSGAPARLRPGGGGVTEGAPRAAPRTGGAVGADGAGRGVVIVGADGAWAAGGATSTTGTAGGGVMANGVRAADGSAGAAGVEVGDGDDCGADHGVSSSFCEGSHMWVGPSGDSGCWVVTPTTTHRLGKGRPRVF